MAPTLKHVLTFRVFPNKVDMVSLGSTKGGAHRFISSLSQGFLKGDGIDAELLPGGSDWATIDSEAGITYLNGRSQFRDKTTGDAFYIRCEGLLKMDEAAQMALEGSDKAKSTKGGDHTWFTTPIIEVSNEAHKWMERSWFISQGHWHIPGDGTQAAEHDVYRLIAG